MAENNERKRDEIFSRAVRAGKRTYFFDVKSTRKGEYYLTITESKRKFNNEQGKFYYEKFKLFLYKEDFDKFKNALGDTIGFINENQQIPEEEGQEEQQNQTQLNKPAENNQPQVEEKEKEEYNEAQEDPFNTSMHTNVDFEDLGENANEEIEESKKYNSK